VALLEEQPQSEAAAMALMVALGAVAAVVVLLWPAVLRRWRPAALRTPVLPVAAYAVALALASLAAGAAWVLPPVARQAPSAIGGLADPRVFGSTIAALILIAAVRAGAHRALRIPGRVEDVLIVGGGTLAHELVAEINRRPGLRLRVIGLLDDRTSMPVTGCPRLGGLRDLSRVMTQVRPRRVIVALSSRRGSMPFKALLGFKVNGIVVEEAVEVYERLTGKIAIEARTPSSLIFSKDFRASRPDLLVGRALSLPLAALGLVWLLPLFALIALAIKLDSGGPVFFVQERVGRAGRRFKLLKFRTMRPVQGRTSEWARDNRSRLTRVGSYLRRYRLDELPQLLNIVMGDMNLVGPRPHPVSNEDLFVLVMRNTPDCGEPIPYYALRSIVRPGLTGWAQVRYQYANDLEEEIEKMRYDLYYIKHMSAWLDLRILCETLKIVLLGRESVHAERRRVRRVLTRPGTPSLRARAEEGRGLIALSALPAEAPAPAPVNLTTRRATGV
jgi:exopolysaccharide biosynthesis polyprenyl glycosylphosphotransferase